MSDGEEVRNMDTQKPSVGTDTREEMPKIWDDLNTEEKIERMRVNVKNIDARCADIGSRINNLSHDIDTLFDHAHDENGKVIIIITKEQRWKIKQGLGGILSNCGQTQNVMAMKDVLPKKTYF